MKSIARIISLILVYILPFVSCSVSTATGRARSAWTAGPPQDAPDSSSWTIFSKYAKIKTQKREDVPDLFRVTASRFSSGQRRHPCFFLETPDIVARASESAVHRDGTDTVVGFRQRADALLEPAACQVVEDRHAHVLF